MKPTGFFVFLPVLVMACVAADPPLPKADACDAVPLQSLVGQSADTLATMRFGQTTRIIRPRMAVTMDFVANRLNIWIGEDNVIERVTCG